MVSVASSFPRIDIIKGIRIPRPSISIPCNNAFVYPFHPAAQMPRFKQTQELRDTSPISAARGPEMPEPASGNPAPLGA